MGAVIRARSVMRVSFLILASVVCLAACQGQPASEPGAAADPVGVRIGVVQRWMDEGETVVFLDSRSNTAWVSGTTKIPGAIRVPPDDVASHIESIPREGKIVVYCT